MDALLQPPSVTGFDAAASVLSLIVYLGVAVAVLMRSPRAAPARVFLVVALCSAVPYGLSPLQWSKGPGVYTPAAIAGTSVAFAIGSIALFHFTQVFPRRRPWIEAHFLWLAAAYAVLAVPVAAVAWMFANLLAPMTAGAGGVGAVSSDGVEAILMLLTIPVLFVVGLVLPFGGVMSLFKSWQEARRDGDAPGRTATFWMIMSQMGGGVLSVLVLPLLHFVGVGAPWSLLIAALAYAFALLLPLAFLRYETLRTSA